MRTARQVECARHNIYQSPHRENNDEPYDAPEDELSPVSAVFFIGRTKDKVLEDAPKEDDEGDSHQDRHENTIDNTGDTVGIGLDDAYVNATT